MVYAFKDGLTLVQKKQDTMLLFHEIHLFSCTCSLGEWQIPIGPWMISKLLAWDQFFHLEVVACCYQLEPIDLT